MKCIRKSVGECSDATLKVTVETSDGQSAEHEGMAALVVVVGDDGTYSTIAGNMSAIDLADMDFRASKTALCAALDAGLATEFMAARIALSGVLDGNGDGE